MLRYTLLLFVVVAYFAGNVQSRASEFVVQGKVETDMSGAKDMKPKSSKSLEDSLPITEIRGEGKPMTAAQIRALEEEANGGPLDIKVKRTWTPKDCPHKAARKDFVVFHYKAFLENGKKFDQTYNKKPITMQLGVGMAIPGLEKGLRGMCKTELRKISVPWRLCQRKRKGKVWKNIPSDEHWVVFDVEIIDVEPWSVEQQFAYMNKNNDSVLTVAEVKQHAEMLRREFGKEWLNKDIDDTLAAKYFIKYFDANGDSQVNVAEYVAKIAEDQSTMSSAKRKKTTGKNGRKRDPGIAWILDFNNDGIVSEEEVETAAEIIEKGELPQTLTTSSTLVPNKDEL